jgi:hypothetical protein
MKIFEMKKVYISVPRIIYPQYQPNWDGKDYKRFVEVADKNLYEAKETGRNKSISTFYK